VPKSEKSAVTVSERVWIMISHSFEGSHHHQQPPYPPRCAP
jgi:hypothetical protein